MSKSMAATTLAILLLSCASAQVHAENPAPSSKPALLVEGATLISPERSQPLASADVLIRNGRIAAIGSRLRTAGNVRRIDGRGRYLIPGLIDTHVHINEPAGLDDAAIEAQPQLLADYRRQLPRSYLAFGFTTLLDLSLTPETRTWFDAAPLRPHLRHCGPGVRTAGGYGARRLRPETGARNLPNLIYEPTQADRWPAALDPADWTVARAVDRVVAAGGICVKAFIEPGFGGTFNWPVPSAETLDSLRAETHKRGLRLFVHANAVDAWRSALAARADVIAHGLWHWPGDRTISAPGAEARQVIDAAARSGIGVQPTSQVVFGQQSIFDPALLDDPRFAESMPPSVVAYLRSDAGRNARRAIAAEYEQIAPNAADLMVVYTTRVNATLRLMSEAGVHLLFGSDTPSGDGGFGNPPGFNGRLELQRWREAGVAPARILRAATIDNARALGLDADIGAIEIGKRADLLLLRANPLAQADAFDTIEVVILDGEPIARSALVATAAGTEHRN
jgi:imidazolonepropionase-like amidohydrolase